MQYLPPEERKGEQRYERGSWILYDDRPSEEKQRALVEQSQKSGERLKLCPVCGSFMKARECNLYCSQRCVNDAYMERRRKRHEIQLRKVCANCGEEFTAKRKDAQYCSQACKQAAYRTRNVTDNRCDKFTTTENGNGYSD